MKIGSLVLCMNDKNIDGYPDDKKPVKGNEYTVREIRKYKKGIGLRFDELLNPVQKWNDKGRIVLEETSFDIIRFREIQPPISIADIFENELKETV